MSLIPTTQDTSTSTSSASSKRGRKAAAPKTEPVVEPKQGVTYGTLNVPAPEATPHPKETVLDLESLLKVGRLDEAQTQEHLRVAAKLTQLETAVVYAQQAKIEWLEVEPEILMHFCKGKLPEVGYYIYKNVKLCLQGQAEDIAKRDGLSCHEVLFPKEGYMKVGVRSGGK